MNYTPNNKLLKIFKNKRVAIVGPSPHLIGTKSGSAIDQYDIVCRVNEVTATGYEEDYGTRTDVVFHNCGTRFINIFKERLESADHISKDLKHVVCPCVKATGSDNNWSSWPDDHVSPVVENFDSINLYDIPFSWIGIPNYREIYNFFGCEPNAGQTAIMMILKHQAKELLITGFSFYAQGNTPAQSHRPGHTNKGLENELIGNPGHQQAPQLAVFKNKILKEFAPNISLDSYLKKMLDL